MKKLKSKKGLSLVELIVTVAILAITSLLLLGIVANSITNYSLASVTSSEQDIASQIEDDLVGFARRANGMELINIDDGTETVPAEDESAYYLCTRGDGRVETITSEVEMVGEPPVVVSYSYRGVKSITLTLKKHKKDAEDTTSEDRYLLVDYVIEMKEGYTLKGTVVMNNELYNYEMEADSDSFVISNEPIQLLPGTGNFAIKFQRKA